MMTVTLGEMLAKMTPEETAREQARAPYRLNIGSGQHPLPFWTNIDSAEDALCDVRLSVPPLPYGDDWFEDIYIGHCLEHFEFEDAAALLTECYRALKVGGRLGVVVPDARAIMGRWLSAVPEPVEYPEGTFRNVADLDQVCALFVFSTVQESRHRWLYDEGTLRRAIRRAGFVDLRPIDRYRDPRLGSGQWYQCGVDAVKG